MPTYHIHIKGIVQGVGFRPYVYRLAQEYRINGTVCNTTDGVHIYINTNQEKAEAFFNSINSNPPKRAIITNAFISETKNSRFHDFRIIESHEGLDKSVLLTPDYALCEECRKELYNPADRRHYYPFITCTLCGPRFSIIQSLPYDRPKTTMESFIMCPACNEEYHSMDDRRYYSQTNSCPDCSINLSIEPEIDNLSPLDAVVESWKEGKIVAIKGIGGYLLTCDATNSMAISTLRKRKHRPSKPLAVMYPNIELLKKDAFVIDLIERELKSPESPIVLTRIKDSPETGLNRDKVAPGLNHIGVMLPYAPLYELLLSKFNKPIVATSGNLSGDPIEFSRESAITNLSAIVNVFLHNDRDIVVPQDDSVVAFSPGSNIKILLRRSRGLAPTYLEAQLELPSHISILAMGGLLKSTFGLITQGNCYISQYLGDTDSYLTQENYNKVLGHLLKVTDTTPQRILCDAHPGFFSTLEAQRLADEWDIEVKYIQHHKAHFSAVLGENHLLRSDEKVLGFVWDGVGLGEDGNIWGGEVFLYENRCIKKADQIPTFKYFLGDKMAKEPRISAYALVEGYNLDSPGLRNKFSEREWSIYHNLISKKEFIMTSSMGRVFDAVASILLNIDVQSYEGEAAMVMESAATRFYFRMQELGEKIEVNPTLDFVSIISGIIKEENYDVEKTAFQFHLHLVGYIMAMAHKMGVNKIAFSGGVFQNQLLVSLIIDQLQSIHQLYWHHQLSPNDENISYGQLMYDLYDIDQSSKKSNKSSISS